MELLTTEKIREKYLKFDKETYDACAVGIEKLQDQIKVLEEKRHNILSDGIRWFEVEKPDGEKGLVRIYPSPDEAYIRFIQVKGPNQTYWGEFGEGVNIIRELEKKEFPL